MKKVIGIVLGALLCSLAATASADESSEHLSRVGANDDNKGLLFTTDGAWDGNICSNRSTLVIDLSTEGGRQMYHTALAAYLAGKVVKAFYSTCSGSYPLASRVDIVGN